MYVKVIWPSTHLPLPRLEGRGLQRLVDAGTDVTLWAIAGTVGGACMIGVVVRRAAAETVRRRRRIARQ